ncbi:reverse transcriptase [Lithospermum erythrorhizon]|uniref:Reverse transcriptase n=1 Tax=Lithospermum erythrorhizon TaxID=34254 RepID=A0AAV3RL12_LITER
MFATGVRFQLRLMRYHYCIDPQDNKSKNIAQFRPIACCNNLYKCLTKILVNRMKPVISQLISPLQSAFIPGRQIGDSIHMLQELVQGYHKDNGSSKAALNIDLKKAYDTIEWGDRWCVMEAIKFPSRFIYLVQQCVEGVRFSVCINGTLKGWFRSSRGVRQGDSMLPYLFLMELGISHLSFTNDMILLSSASIGSFKAIKEAYGDGRREPSMRYLGIPLSSRKLGKEDYSKLIARIYSSISNWQARHLSLAGRALLIRTSVFGLQNFWCSQVPIPKYVIQEVEIRVRSFLWSGKEGGRSIAKVAWDTVCLPLKEEGLGFKSIQVWSTVCLCKMLWNIVARKESLWVKWVHTVRLKGVSIWAYKKRDSDPWLWKKVLQMRGLIQGKYRVVIGNGRSISFWFDPWCSVGVMWDKLSDGEKLTMPVPRNASLFEAQMVLLGSRRQISTILRVYHEFQTLQLTIERVDECVWIESGGFTQRWRIPKQSFIVWLLFQGKMSTRDRLVHWGINVDTLCMFYSQAESQEHPFFSCGYSGKCLRKRLRQLCFTTAVYSVVREEQA